MASELRVTTIANNAGSESVDTTYVVNGSAKAFIFQNTGTTIRKSLNVASLVDNGSGDYIVNFTNNMDDIYYLPTSAQQPHDYTSSNVMIIHGTRDNTDQNTDHFHQMAGKVSSTHVDSNGMRSTVFGDLA